MQRYPAGRINPDVSPGAIVIPPSGDSTGATDYARLQYALNTGLRVLLQKGSYYVNQKLTASGAVQLLGQGYWVTTIQAVTGVGANPLLSLDPRDGYYIADLTVDGNSIATYALELQHSPETSIPGTVARVQGLHATSWQFHINGVEDISIEDCLVGGDESSPGTVPQAILINLPEGAGFIRGGAIFGEVRFSAQQLHVSGATIGPLVCSNPTPNPGILAIDGCYVYDWGVNHRACVDTVDNLYSIIARGTTFVLQQAAAFVNGAMPAKAVVKLDGCHLWQTGSNPNATVYMLQASGSGYFDHGGNWVDPKSGGTISNYNAISGGTTTVTQIGGTA